MKKHTDHYICNKSGSILGHNNSSKNANILELIPTWQPTKGKVQTHVNKISVNVTTDILSLNSNPVFLVSVLGNTDDEQPIFLQIQMKQPVSLKEDNPDQLINNVINAAYIGFCSDITSTLLEFTTHKVAQGQSARSVFGLPKLFRIVERAISKAEPEKNDRLFSTNLQVIDNEIHAIHCIFHQGKIEKSSGLLLTRPQLIEQIEQFVRQKKFFSLLMIDIDNFKTVNSTLGHVLGDIVLKELSLRIFDLSKKRKGIAAHLNGDKFAWIIPVISVKHDIESLAYRMLTELRQPLLINKIPLEMDASIGIASFPTEGYSAVSLLRKAESSMLHAKDSSFKVKQYQPNVEHNPQQRLMVMAGIPNAISNQEFHLVFQPQVHISSRQLKGFECLLRWSKNNKSFSPGLFIPLAEMSHHIHDITKWVIKECLTQLAYWQSIGKEWTVSINFSSKNLMDMRLISYLSNQCLKHDIPTKYVIIEVTESALMVDIDNARSLLERLHNEGFKISIDDFGTGYSSLAYLKHLPVNMIKIDKTFVTDITTDKTDATICKALIDMSHDLNIEVVAEGIENKAALQKLNQLGCDYAQGYFISKGITADKVISFDKKFQTSL